MNTLRTHTNNLISLLRRASIDKGNTGAFFPDFVVEVATKYEESPEYSLVGTAAAEKAAARAAKTVKVYEKDENGNPIKPKRGRPVGSKNRPKANVVTEPVVPVAPEPTPETTPSTPAVVAEA